MPPLADLVFDMRFLDNPHWDPLLRPQTGHDEAVGAHIESDAAFAPAFARIRDLVLELLPHYADQGRAYAAALRAAGRTAELLDEGGLVHGFADFAGVVPEARRAVDRAADALMRVMG